MPHGIGSTREYERASSAVPLWREAGRACRKRWRCCDPMPCASCSCKRRAGSAYPAHGARRPTTTRFPSTSCRVTPEHGRPIEPWVNDEHSCPLRCHVQLKCRSYTVAEACGRGAMGPKTRRMDTIVHSTFKVNSCGPRAATDARPPVDGRRLPGAAASEVLRHNSGGVLHIRAKPALLLRRV